MQSSQPLSEATAIRLFNSVVVSGNESSGGSSPLLPHLETVDEQKSIISIQSSTEFGSCRICRYNRSDMQILQCPCNCKGSVGYVHLQCLKRWILHRRDNNCEICNVPFDIPDEKMNISRMFRSFMYPRCCGAIMRHLLYGISLVPLSHVILQQVLFCMENINKGPNEELTVGELAMASCALLASSAIFFQFMEYITRRLFVIRNILRQWWVFGNTNDFAVIELESESMEFLQ